MIRREVGMVFQQFNLFPHLTVLQNISLTPILVRRSPKAKAEELAMQLLERVGILEQAQKYPGQLSGGQQQRVAIASKRKLYHVPPVFGPRTLRPNRESLSARKFQPKSDSRSDSDADNYRVSFSGNGNCDRAVFIAKSPEGWCGVSRCGGENTISRNGCSLATRGYDICTKGISASCEKCLRLID